MKKLAFTLFIVFNLVTFAASYKDGVYYVVADKDTFGWKPFTQLTIKDGSISEIVTDRINKKGQLASKDSSYNENMKNLGKTSPAEYTVAIIKNFFKANENLDKMDAVAGATGSLKEFKIMTKFLLEKATLGQTGKYEIKMPDLK